jgi:UDP-N-acetylmuramyl pentapeptide phosphotransferase/UDP-N-acetylglucosamine-1-phosphate transferase
VILLAWAIGACLMTFGVGLFVATYGANVGLVDAPSGRSSHTEATPRAGGLGIAVWPSRNYSRQRRWSL